MRKILRRFGLAEVSLLLSLVILLSLQYLPGFAFFTDAARATVVVPVKLYAAVELQETVTGFTKEIVVTNVDEATAPVPAYIRVKVFCPEGYTIVQTGGELWESRVKEDYYLYLYGGDKVPIEQGNSTEPLTIEIRDALGREISVVPDDFNVIVMAESVITDNYYEV